MKLIDLDALPENWQIEDIVFAPIVEAIPVEHIKRRIKELEPAVEFEHNTSKRPGCFFWALQEEEKLLWAWENGISGESWNK